MLTGRSVNFDIRLVLKFLERTLHCLWGFNFREGFLEVEDDFVDANKMARRGTMEISDDQGNTVEVPFTAVFTFDRPVPVRKGVAN